MTRRSGSRVAWYSKNCLILKVHPEGSEPSKRGTSSFMLGRMGVVLDEFVKFGGDMELVRG